MSPGDDESSSDSEYDDEDGKFDKRGTLSARAQKARDTKVRDQNHKQSVAEKNVKRKMKGCSRTRAKAGYLYVFRDPELDLIKVGSAGRLISRLVRIQSACRMGRPLQIII